jgi:hypothetical protein
MTPRLENRSPNKVRKILNAAVIPVRLPAPMDEWLQKEATRNATSRNAEIRRCVRMVMDEQARREQADLQRA